jgi:hypothetical protein
VFVSGTRVSVALHGLINPLRTKFYLSRRPGSYRAVNTMHLGYKNQSVNAV